MTSVHLSLPGPNLVCGVGVSLPLLAAALTLGWRWWRSTRQKDDSK